MKKQKKAEFGFIRGATISPRCRVSNVDYNVGEILRLARIAAKQDTRLMLFPEMAITGYSIRDLVKQTLLRRKALEGLERLRDASKSIPAVMTIGFPIEVDGMIINAAATIDRGSISGIVPKSYLPVSGEFEEARWFHPGHSLLKNEIKLFGENVPFETNLIFQSKTVPNAAVVIEVCQDAWTSAPPGAFHALAGGTIILNPSASNELVGKGGYREMMVTMHSASRYAGYMYASCGPTESTTDVVFGGHCLIAENGQMLIQTEPLRQAESITYADIDIDRLKHDRIADPSFGENARHLLKYLPKYRIIPINLETTLPKKPLRPINIHPFTSERPEEQARIVDTVFAIQVWGIMKRLDASGIKRVSLGLSGGKDSALAFLVCVKAFEALGWSKKNIYATSMPGAGTSDATRALSRDLAKAAGTSFEEISVIAGAQQSLKDIGHDGVTQDVTYENAYARQRTLTLMQKCNKLGALLVGTGDLSEIANGFCTYNGDHISHYNVNCGVPKGLVKYILQHVAIVHGLPAVRKVTAGIMGHPDSPELTHSTIGRITQITEDKVGPYELAEFFLYEFVRWGTEPKKILYLAQVGFGKKYKPAVIKKWLVSFYKRFFWNHWKRSVATDGPQAGSVSLSPRGMWRMPSDADVSMWLRELKD